MQRFLFLLLASFILGGCVTPAIKKDYPLGKTYRDVFVLENKRVPLPEGEWKVAGTGYTDMGNYCEVSLLKETKDHKIAGIIIITSDSQTTNYTGYWPNKYVQRTDLHYVSIKSNTGGQYLDLWAVSHYIMTFTPERETVREFFQYCSDNNIILPKLMVRSYHVITGKMLRNKYLRVEYYYNPEKEGFDTSSENNWGASSWHPLRIQTDPNKVSYVEG